MKAACLKMVINLLFTVSQKSIFWQPQIYLIIFNILLLRSPQYFFVSLLICTVWSCESTYINICTCIETLIWLFLAYNGISDRLNVCLWECIGSPFFRKKKEISPRLEIYYYNNCKYTIYEYWRCVARAWNLRRRRHLYDIYTHYEIFFTLESLCIHWWDR